MRVNFILEYNSYVVTHMTRKGGLILMNQFYT
nr:MAG TPA: hypothetical protein [Caudoviricetes sp.]